VAVIEQKITDNFAAYNADCMEVLPTLKSESVGFSIYSPPFPELYQYSSDPRDMSNCANYNEGMEQYQFVVNEIARLLKPGRLTAVHCMDLKNGTMYQRDFPGDIIRAHEKAGLNFFCRITVWKEPLSVARRTRMRGLTHKMITADSSVCRVVGGDYILIFRKTGDNPEPITHEFGFKTYAGTDQPPPALVHRFRDFKGHQKENLLSHYIWRRYASCVWMDIRTGRLLPHRNARETDEEKHVCPLQLDVIERCLSLWTNPGDIVLTPFLGVGSEAYMALRMGRKAIGVELKPTYYHQALQNLASAMEGVGSDNDELPLEFADQPDDEDDEGEDSADDQHGDVESCGLCGSPNTDDHECKGGI